jgi:hypothetical protein
MRAKIPILLLALVSTACSAIRFGGPPAPPPPQLAGGWTGYIEVEGQQILGTLQVSQEDRDLGATFLSTGLIAEARGQGKIAKDGTVTMELGYRTQCDGKMVLAGTAADPSRLQGTVSATDCTGTARGGFTFTRR